MTFGAAIASATPQNARACSIAFPFWIDVVREEDSASAGQYPM